MNGKLQYLSLPDFMLLFGRIPGFEFRNVDFVLEEDHIILPILEIESGGDLLELLQGEDDVAADRYDEILYHRIAKGGCEVESAAPMEGDVLFLDHA